MTYRQDPRLGCYSRAPSVLISEHEVVVVQLVAVCQHLALDLGGVHPRHKVLHVACDQEGWVRHRLRANTHMTLQRGGAGAEAGGWAGEEIHGGLSHTRTK